MLEVKAELELERLRDEHIKGLVGHDQYTLPWCVVVTVIFGDTDGVLDFRVLNIW